MVFVREGGQLFSVALSFNPGCLLRRDLGAAQTGGLVFVNYEQMVEPDQAQDAAYGGLAADQGQLPAGGPQGAVNAHQHGEAGAVYVAGAAQVNDEVAVSQFRKPGQVSIQHGRTGKVKVASRGNDQFVTGTEGFETQRRHGIPPFQSFLRIFPDRAAFPALPRKECGWVNREIQYSTRGGVCQQEWPAAPPASLDKFGEFGV